MEHFSVYTLFIQLDCKCHYHYHAYSNTLHYPVLSFNSLANAYGLLAVDVVLSKILLSRQRGTGTTIYFRVMQKKSQIDGFVLYTRARACSALRKNKAILMAYGWRIHSFAVAELRQQMSSLSDTILESCRIEMAIIILVNSRSRVAFCIAKFCQKNFFIQFATSEFFSSTRLEYYECVYKMFNQVVESSLTFKIEETKSFWQ